MEDQGYTCKSKTSIPDCLNVCILEFIDIILYLRNRAGRRRKVSNECTYVALFAFCVNSS